MRQHDEEVVGVGPCHPHHCSDPHAGNSTGQPGVGNVRHDDGRRFGNRVEQRSRHRPRLDTAEPECPYDTGIAKIHQRAVAVVEQVRRRRAFRAGRHQDARLAISPLELVPVADDQCGGRVVTDGPRGFVLGQRVRRDIGRAGDTQQWATLCAVDLRVVDDTRLGCAARDEVGRRQVHDGVQGVADADVERSGVAGHDDRRITQRGIRTKERQDRAYRDADDCQHAARDRMTVIGPASDRAAC